MVRRVLLYLVAFLSLAAPASLAAQASNQTLQVAPLPRDGEVLVSFKLEEPLTDLDLVRADQQVLAVALQERPAAERADGVGHERPERVADRREHDDDPEVPGRAGERLDLTRVRDEEAGVGEDQLRRQRDHRRFDRHRHHDPEVPEGAVQVVEERDDDLVDELEHADLGCRWGRAAPRIADYPRPSG